MEMRIFRSLASSAGQHLRRPPFIKLNLAASYRLAVGSGGVAGHSVSFIIRRVYEEFAGREKRGEKLIQLQQTDRAGGPQRSAWGCLGVVISTGNPISSVREEGRQAKL